MVTEGITLLAKSDGFDKGPSADEVRTENIHRICFSTFFPARTFEYMDKTSSVHFVPACGVRERAVERFS